jgi:hypothetical protein
VSGNYADRLCFRISFLNCDVSSADVHWRLPRSAAIVSQLVTRLPVSVSPASYGSGGGWSSVHLAARITSGSRAPRRRLVRRYGALGALGLGSLLLTQVRYEHPASIKDAEAQELATREAADMRRADSASAQLTRDGLDGLPADPTGLN